MRLLRGRGPLRLIRRHTFSAAAAATVGTALLASCVSPAEPSDVRGSLTTDAADYVAYALPGSLPRYQFQIISRFENRGSSTVYLGRCYPDSRQPLFSVGSTTAAESGYLQVWACVGHDRQFAVRAGETRVDTLLVTGPNVFQGGTNTPFGVSEGDFRLSFDVRIAAGDDAPAAPASSTLSNAFRVRTTSSVAP